MSSIGPEAPSRDVDATLADFDNVPLFMRSLPDDPSGQNDVLEALQSLVHDGTPDAIALNFKEQGNDYFKGKRYREALGFYTQGIDAKPTDLSLMEALLCNRAACNLELQNYGSTMRDCAQAITMNPHSSKAFYRSAVALRRLERFEDVVDACERCLAFDSGNSPVKKLLEEVKTTIEIRALRESEKARKAKEEQEQKNLLHIACKARQLAFVTSPEGKSNPNQHGFPHFDPEGTKPYTVTSEIIFPVFLLYPAHNTSDFIAFFPERTTFADQLAAILPPDLSISPPSWDAKGEYRWGNVSIYVITRRQRLLKVGGKMSLAEVLLNAGYDKEGKEDGLQVRDGCLSFVVLAKGQVERNWIEVFKKERDGK